MKLKQFYKNTAFVIIFNGVALACGLGKNIILGRFLSESDLGLYSLLLAIASFFHPLSLIGQQTSLVRFLTTQSVQAYNCVKGVSQILAISLGIILVGSLIASSIYTLGVLAFFFIVISAFSNSATDLIPGILRAQGIYALSIFMFRGVNLFMILALLLLSVSGQVQLENVLWVFLLVSGGFALGTATTAAKFFGKGNKDFPAALWKDGALFLGTHLSLLVIVSIDRLLIPKLVSFEALGLYFAISAVMRLFELAVQSIEFVLLPDIHRLTKERILVISMITLGAGLLLVAFYWATGPYLVSLVYNGRYDHGIFLIPFFSAIGAASFIYVIPYTIISGRLPSKCLRHLLLGNTVAMIINVVLALVLISKFGLVGAAWATIIVWVLRIAIALIIIRLETGPWFRFKFRPSFLGRV